MVLFVPLVTGRDEGKWVCGLEVVETEVFFSTEACEDGVSPFWSPCLADL